MLTGMRGLLNPSHSAPVERARTNEILRTNGQLGVSLSKQNIYPMVFRVKGIRDIFFCCYYFL